MRRIAALVTAAFLPCSVAAVADTPAAPAGAQFGRFGRVNDDGLLTLNVSPDGFETPFGEILRVRWGDGASPAQATVTHIDPTEKDLTLAGGGDGAPVAVRYSLLYPGLSATFGKRLVLRFQNQKGEPFRLKTGQSLADAAEGGVNGMEHSGVEILNVVSTDGAELDLLLNADGVHRVTQARFTSPATFEIDADVPLGEVCFLTGVVGEAAAMIDFRRPPRRTGTAATLSPDGKSVTVTETFDGSVAPLPPVLAFALQHDYPARVAGKVVFARDTKYGPFAYVRGHLLRYTLPVPPAEERGYVRIEGQDPRHVALLGDLVGHLGGSWVKNAVDLGYAGMANAQMAWTYLTPQRRAAVADAWRRYLPRAWNLPLSREANGERGQGGEVAWHEETEPFTQQSYLWTYCIDGPGGYRYDLDWGDALPLYGLYKYAEYTGDWQFVREHWTDVKRVCRYFDLGDDWAWMTAVNADHGYSTGTGDPLCAVYGASVACLKMARVLGDREAEREFAVRAARVAVAAEARFDATSWARQRGILGPQSVALGYQEEEGFTRSRLGGSPWGVSTLLSGDGVLPELFTMYRAYGREAVRRYEGMYAAAFPYWYEGDYAPAEQFAYKGNSVYVAFPHVYARAAVLDEPTADLWRYVDGIQRNRNNAWIGPNVVAEALSRRPGATTPFFLLTEWQPVAYRDGFVSADRTRAMLDFAAVQPVPLWTLTARIDSACAPAAVRVAGRPVAFQFEDGLLTIHARLAKAETFRVEVALKPHPGGG